MPSLGAAAVTYRLAILRSLQEVSLQQTKEKEASLRATYGRCTTIVWAFTHGTLVVERAHRLPFCVIPIAFIPTVIIALRFEFYHSNTQIVHQLEWSMFIWTTVLDYVEVFRAFQVYIITDP